MYRRFLSLFFCLVGFQLSLHAQDLHLFILADTNDYVVGTSTKIDIQRMEALAEEICHYTDLNLKKQIVKGNELGRAAFEAMIQTPVAEEDVILFHWSGHGMRTSEKDDESNFPYLIVGPERIAIDHYEVTCALQELNPQLLISISDACNGYVGSDDYDIVSLVDKMEKSANLDQCMQINYRKLFQESKGTIFVTGSKPGGYALCNIFKGGFLTKCLAQEVYQAVKADITAEWQTILENVEQRVLDLTDDKQL